MKNPDAALQVLYYLVPLAMAILLAGLSIVS